MKELVGCMLKNACSQKTHPHTKKSSAHKKMHLPKKAHPINKTHP